MAVLAAVATVANVLGSISDTNAQVGSFKAQAKGEQYNAQVLRNSAGMVGAEGARNEEAQRRDFRDFAGRQAAGASEGGVGLGGSVFDVIRDSETRANLDALNIRYAADTKRQNLNQEAGMADMRSSLARQMAKRARATGTLRTIGAAASGAAQTRSAFKAGGGWT